ncbi:hypothetical protein M0804_011225 [Polistes exclamans]|nr:hypothetical protein M0804_011225 [Polistes exclamans]
MLTTSIDSPQHKKVLGINNKGNNNNDFVSSGIYRTYKSNEEVIRMKKIREIHLELIKSTLVFILYHFCLHVKNTGDILCELYEPSISKELRAEIRDFIIQLIQNPLLLTTCGFFNLDNTLISNVISTVTTYLVILIQVGNVPIPFYPNSTLSTIDF